MWETEELRLQGRRRSRLGGGRRLPKVTNGFWGGGEEDPVKGLIDPKVRRKKS